MVEGKSVVQNLGGHPRAKEQCLQRPRDRIREKLVPGTW